MALETPNQTIASAVLLIQGFEDPPNETVEFLSNAGFQSVRFISDVEPELGLVLALSNPVNNNEGQVSIGGDLTLDLSGTQSYITPNHFLTSESSLDALEPHQVAIVSLSPLDDVFRLTVQVSGQQAIVPANPNEPVAP